MSLESIIAEIEQLNVLELVQLTKTLQDKWGVSAAPVAVAAGVAAPAAAAEAPAAAPVEEQTEFDAILSEVGPNKEGVSKEEAEKIAEKMAEVGAKVTIK